MKLTKLFFTASILIIYSCQSDSGSSSNPYSSGSSYNNGQTYEQNKISLEDKEKRNPLQFLSSKGTYRQNLMGKWVMEGKIINSATVAAYKDVVLEFKFYSKTNTLLGTQKMTIYEYVNPGSSKSFKIKLNGYRNTGKIGWEVIDAKSAN